MWKSEKVMKPEDAKKNTGQLWKSHTLFQANSYITELRKMGYDQAKLQVEYETEESERVNLLSGSRNKYFLLIQNLQKNLLQKIVFRNAKM